jgi:hypothetical protein
LGLPTTTKATVISSRPSTSPREAGAIADQDFEVTFFIRTPSAPSSPSQPTGAPPLTTSSAALAGLCFAGEPSLSFSFLAFRSESNGTD